MKKILVIRLGAIGDVLLTTPFLRVLKKKYPNCDIDFLVKDAYVSLIAENPNVADIISFPNAEKNGSWLGVLKIIQNKKYDVIIDLQNNLRSRLWGLFSDIKNRKIYHLGRWQRFLLVYCRMNRDKQPASVPQKYLQTIAEWGVKEDEMGAELFIPQPVQNALHQKIKKYSKSVQSTLVLLAPGASRKTKRWPVENYIQVASYFLREGMTVGLIGGENDVVLCEEMSLQIKGPVLNLAGKCRLLESAAAIKFAKLVITNDTGMMHLSTAVSTPVVAIFGPTSNHLGFFPYHAKSIVMEKDLRCRPCSFHGAARCPRKHFKCMKDIKPKEVIESAIQLLNN